MNLFVNISLCDDWYRRYFFLSYFLIDGFCSLHVVLRHHTLGAKRLLHMICYSGHSSTIYYARSFIALFVRHNWRKRFWLNVSADVNLEKRFVVITSTSCRTLRLRQEWLIFHGFPIEIFWSSFTRILYRSSLLRPQPLERAFWSWNSRTRPWNSHSLNRCIRFVIKLVYLSGISHWRIRIQTFCQMVGSMSW